MRRRGSAAVLASVAATALLGAGAAAAQDVGTVADACGGGMVDLRADCVEGALALQAAAGIVGLAGSGGTELPGSSSTLGRRLGASPRLALSLRVGGVAERSPDLADEGGLAGDRGVFAPVVQGIMAAGLFDGFSPAPTMGGLLSLDVIGSAGRVFLPAGAGYEEGSNVFGLGVRVGLLRESFTLPGVTLSATRRWSDEVRLGRPTDPDRTGVVSDVTVTSLRGTVGKDLLALGLLAGGGWDRYVTDGRVQVRHAAAGGGSMVGAADVEGFTSDRAVFFAGASYTFLVLQFSAEGGWTRGYGEVVGRAGRAYDPTDGRLFGSVSARLTF